MLKRVEEDWSYFNAAVREKAQGKSWQEPPPFGLAPLPDPARPAPQQPKPPPPAPSLTPPHTVNPIPTVPRPRPTDDGVLPKFFSRLFLIVLAIIGALWLIALGNDRTHVISTAANPVGAYSTPPATSGGTNAVVTNYTLFKTVALGDWQVVTGWNFRRSGDETPFEQYCYVGAETPAGKLRYDIETRHGATSRTKHPQPDALVPGLSEAVWSEAAQKCQWHH